MTPTPKAPRIVSDLRPTGDEPDTPTDWQRAEARLRATYAYLIDQHNALADRFDALAVDRDELARVAEELAAELHLSHAAPAPRRGMIATISRYLGR